MRVQSLPKMAELGSSVFYSYRSTHKKHAHRHARTHTPQSPEAAKGRQGGKERKGKTLRGWRRLLRAALNRPFAGGKAQHTPHIQPVYPAAAESGWEKVLSPCLPHAPPTFIPLFPEAALPRHKKRTAGWWSLHRLLPPPQTLAVAPSPPELDITPPNSPSEVSRIRSRAPLGGSPVCKNLPPPPP